MTAPAQRATLVLEHASARDDAEEQEEEGAEPWSVVAYLIYDSGLRKRATLCRHKTREAAARALADMWDSITR
ncbi:MAG: hypothetical protein OEM59_16585 [Rhodospirillales bacterium]|nr:hypothetical protein [Rhodospirillales bacterium]